MNDTTQENIEAIIAMACYIDLAIPPCFSDGYLTEFDIMKFVSEIILETKLLSFYTLERLKRKTKY